MSQKNLLFVLLILISSVITAKENLNGYQYISPIPGSSLVSPYNNIIIKYGAELNLNNIQNNFIKVVGSISGEHSGNIILSDDKMTLIYSPSKHFELGEVVSVNLNKGSFSKKGENLNEFLFQFKVRENEPTKKRVDIEAFLSEIQPQSSKQFYSQPNSQINYLLPEGFPPINLMVSDEPADGKFFLAPFNFQGKADPYLLIMDNSGIPIFYRKMDGSCLDFKLQTNGMLTYFDNNNHKYYAMNSFYEIVDSFACGNGYQTDAHELNILPNGHSLLMSYDLQPYPMDTVVAGGDPNATVIGLVIQELDNNKNVVFQWRSWDHYKITDAMEDIDLTAPLIDYVHGNAIEMDNDGNLLISSRHMDEVTKIDRATGDILWRLGGKNNEFTFINDDYKFSHQHDIRRLPNGNITLFDNGNLHSPLFSRAVEYQLDENSKTATLAWEYRNNLNFYSSAMGSNRVLPNGNRIIGWGFKGNSFPDVTEINNNGKITFAANFPDTIYSYRAFKFPWKTNLFTVSSYNVGFGNVALGDSASLTVTLKNNSQNELSITNFYNRNKSFSVTNEVPFTIQPGEETPLTIKYKPDSTSLSRTKDNLYILSEKSLERISQVISLSGNTIVSVDNENLTPTEFNLSQNYPNPFNPSTTIEYSIPSSMGVNLNIYNLLGEKVAVLVNKEQNAGNYKIQFDGSNLSSGIYFYKLTAGNFSQIKKLTLIK